MKELKHQQKNNSLTDKKYFTQIPNYILDHSTANDQALYLQMKRYAGEDGECFATEQTLMKKLHKGKKAFDKSLGYLLLQGWVIFTGKTPSKTRPINTYKIADIWKMNNNFYENINAERNISKTFVKDKLQKKELLSQKQYKIAPERNTEEEPYLIRTKEEEGEKPDLDQQKRIQKIKDEINMSLGRKPRLIESYNNESP